MPDATDGPERYPQYDGHRHGVHREVHRNGEMFDNQVLDRLVGEKERGPQMASTDVPGPASILHIPWIIQTHLLAQCRDALRISAITEDRDGHITGNHPHDGKNQP